MPAIVHLDHRVAKEAVPPLGGMEERVGIAHVCPGEPDDPGKHAGTRVRGKADHEVADEVFGFCDVVERGQTVALDEQVVHELCNADHVLGAGIRDKDVLRVELDHLRVVLEIVPVRVFRVARASGVSQRTPAPHRGGCG